MGLDMETCTAYKLIQESLHLCKFICCVVLNVNFIGLKAVAALFELSDMLMWWLTLQVKGPDPGYFGTAILITQSALTVLEEKDKLPQE